MTARRDTVLAAGAVVWRAATQEPEICLVHRPKYDDWSLPKGKIDRGEHALVAAVREVWEETGHRVVLGRPLPRQRYEAAGRPKRVHYWLAEADPAATPREPDDEVDEVVFLPATAALDRLSYRRDAELVRSALAAGPLRTTPLVLLRHAPAVARGDWSGPDIERPLSSAGVAELVPLADALSTLGLHRAITSDSVRCVDTIRPFTERHRITVELEPRLSEESLRVPEGGHPGIDVVRSLAASGPAVVCSHRPVLPLLFEALGTDTGRPLEPGEFAVLHLADGAVVATDRHRAHRC